MLHIFIHSTYFISGCEVSSSSNVVPILSTRFLTQMWCMRDYVIQFTNEHSSELVLFAELVNQVYKLIKTICLNQSELSNIE